MSRNLHTKKLLIAVCSFLFVLCTNGFSQITAPNTIENFTAEKLNNKVKLKWSVNVEVNIDSYEIERSNDGVSYIQISAHNSNGNIGNNAAYVKFDDSPLEGSSFYRILSLGFNGDTTSMKTIAFNNQYLSEELPIFNMYPNPYKGGNLTIEFVALISENSQIVVTDINGKTLYDSLIVSDIISLSLNLSSGVYFVSVLSPSNRLIKKLIVD